jgi:hypothetical protein
VCRDSVTYRREREEERERERERVCDLNIPSLPLCFTVSMAATYGIDDDVGEAECGSEVQNKRPIRIPQPIRGHKQLIGGHGEPPHTVTIKPAEKRSVCVEERERERLCVCVC